MKFRCSAYFLVLLSIFGCTFSPTDEYFREVKKVNLSDPTYSINLVDYKDGDTIYLYNSPDFKYAVQVASGNLLNVAITLADRQVFSSTQYSGTFNLKDYLTTGILELKIQYKASAGTGSLADVTGNEQIQIWKKWILKVDIDKPPSPGVQASIVNGFLKFTWNKYPKPNFVAYHLYYSRTGSQIYHTIKDPSINFFIDSSYVGNETAMLQVYTEGYGSGPSSTQSKTTQLGILNLKYSQTDSIATLSWMKSPYSSALKEYDLYVDGQLQNSFINLTDTTYSFKVNAIYGYTNQLELRYPVKYINSKFSGYEKFTAGITNTVAAKKFPRPWNRILFNKGSNSIMAVKYISSGEMVYRFDTDLTLLDSLVVNNGQLAYVLPYSGTSIYYSKGVPGYFFDQDVSTKQENANQVSIIGTGPGLQGASGNGVVCYTYAYPAGPGYTQIQDVIFNLNTNTYLYPDSRAVSMYSYQTDYMTISDDATSFTINGTYYNLNGSTFTKVGSFTTGTIIGYRQDNPKEILVQSSSSLKVFNASDLSLNRTIQPPTGYTFYIYDPVTRQALFAGAMSSYLIDIDTQQKREVKIYPTTLGSFIAGYLISPNGDYIKL